MRKIYFFGTGLLLLCLAGWGFYEFHKPHSNVSGETAVATLSATTLYNEFAHTEAPANQKWVGKVIGITGVISSVSEAGNYLSVSLRATADGSVDCSVLKKDLDASYTLKAGDSVMIKGKCAGFLMDVNMVDCVVQKYHSI